ncbi:zinc finger protein Xfin isoform X2 [Strongylocentrotus purpuratus]|uniref:C2H2-type domain-containing protein n=1 Tax=Strongylocentrotus purpuratus TaxID=7668 RepID=A0A7M7SWX1_STRPU|nr:zinc finger protein Xfin isoform X2 [Strongylocentrotus purpuratus]
MTSLSSAEQLETKDDVPPTLTQELQSEVKEPALPVEQNCSISPETEDVLHDHFLLPCTVKVKCGGCGKEAEVLNQDDTSPDLTEFSYICDICKSRAQKKLRLHQLINGGTFAAQEQPDRTEPKRKHPCPHCFKEFNSQKDMKRHTNIHTGLKPYACDTCGKSFSQSCSLKRHLVTHTDSKPHRCEVCGQTFRGHLARHMRSHTGEKPFTCEICQKGFYRSELLKRHLAEHMTDGSVSGSKSKLDDIFQRSLTKQHTCLICDKTYTNSGHLARHMKQHNNENVLRCGVCTKVFYIKDELQEHLQGHSKEDLAAIIAGTLANLPMMTNGSPPSPEAEDDPIKEELAPEDDTPAVFPSQDAAPEEHACLEDKVTCGICGHACCCTNYIPLHMENHEETMVNHEEPMMVQCRSCGMDFAPSGANKGSTICNVCKPEQAGMGAQPKSDDIQDDEGDEAQDDVQDDDGLAAGDDEEKRHQCLECDKTYKYIKHLREHARIHAGGYRPYKCPTCSKTFSKRYHLNRHMLIHGRHQQRQQQSQSKTLAGVKGRIGRPPHTMGRPPNTVGRPPNTVGRPPNTVGRPPKTVGRPPHTVGRPPHALGRPPHTVGRPPHTVGRPPHTVGRPVGRPPLQHVVKKGRVGRPRLTDRKPQLTEMKPVVAVAVNVYARPKPHSGGMPFVCSACGKGFLKRVPLKRHLLNHLQEGTIPKDHPQINEMKVNSYVNANMGEAPSPQLQTCPICTKVCKGLHLYRHMKIHSKEEIAKAKEGAIGSSSPQLQQQQQQQHKRPQMKISSREAQGEMDYEKDESHFDGEDSDEENMEDEEEEEDGSMSMLKDGDLNVKEEPPEEVKEHTCLEDKVTCGICGHNCCCANYITVHMEMHSNESENCGKCGKELGDLPSTYVKGGRICSICASRSRKQLRLHQILRNRVIPSDLPAGVTKKRIECPHCPKSFVDRKYFREHLRIHTGEKRYHCSFCGMGFAHSRNFKRHVWRHTGEKPNWCNICNKGIAGHLARHMRSHSTEKSYVCNMCHKGFNRSEHLKRHLKTHLGMHEEYQCHLCSKKYLRKEHLKRHVRSHEDGTLTQQGGAGSNELSPVVMPVRPPVNDQPYREHPCTYNDAVCGLCGDACCCANYLPFHMEVHGEKAEDYIEGGTVKKGATPRQGGDGEKPVRDHSCTYDPVTCGLCGQACCCANYIPLHMEIHGEKAKDLPKDHILKDSEGESLTEAHEAPQIAGKQVKGHPCLQYMVSCGICGDVCCCTNYIPFHMEQHNEQATESIGEDDIIKKALDASDIASDCGDDVKPHPCTHELISCGICGEPCCCPNYIPFHMKLHSEVMDQEPICQEEVAYVANPTTVTDQDVADTADAVQEVTSSAVEAVEAVPTPEAVEAPRAVPTLGPKQEAFEKQVVNNGSAVMEEHVEEFDWASVANFLQGTPEPDPLPVPPLLASGSNVEPLNGSPIKEEPSTASHVDEHQVTTDHVCLQAEVTCETCDKLLCCINILIPHLDTHKVISVRCELCQRDVEMTKTVTVLKDGVKIYKCGSCVMGISMMSSSPSRTSQLN